MGRASRRAVAFHEAGHAVVAESLGVRVAKATIIPGPGFAGRVRHEHALDREASILIAFAGAHAEARLRGRRPRLALRPGAAGWAGGDVARYGAGYDIRHAHRWAHGPLGRDREERRAYLRWLWQRARLLVADRWDEIEAVAAALLKRGTLSGAAVRRVLARVERQGEPPDEAGEMPGRLELDGV